MNRYNQPLARHAANEYGGWVKIIKQFRLSQAHGAGLIWVGHSITNDNFTYITMSKVNLTAFIYKITS